MNERILKLREQAGLQPYYDAQESQIERFAELIVKECAKIADIADENECEWIGGNILTHFGVKE